MKFNKLEEVDGGKYLKLKDGESVVGVPRGEIYSFKLKWENGKSVVLGEPNPAKHNRFAMNFVVKSDAGYQAKTWEYGITLYNTLSEFASEMDLTKTKIKVTRKGTGTDTVYVLVPLGQIETNSLNEIESLKLNILDKKPSNGPSHLENPWAKDPNPVDDEMDIPF